MELQRIWIAMLTHLDEPAGTDSRITITVQSAGEQRLDHTFPDTTQLDQNRAQANLYQVDVARRGILAEDLTESSIRIGIRGRDAWRPEHIFIWGERRTGTVFESPVVPLAIRMGINTQLSADEKEGPASLPMTLVRLGGIGEPIRRLFLLTLTGGRTIDAGIVATGISAKGTDNPLEIRVVSGDRLAALAEVRDTYQSDLRAGGANFYAASVIAPFRRRDLDNRSMTLRINGLDDWEPASLFVFGLEDASSRPEYMVPLVHLPAWPYGNMEADTLTGSASQVLELAPGYINLQDALGGVIQNSER